MICLLEQIERPMLFILTGGHIFRNPQNMAAQAGLTYRQSVQDFSHKNWILLTVESIFYPRDTRLKS